MIESPSATDDVSGTVGESVRITAEVSSITSDEGGINTEGGSESSDVSTSVGAESVKDGEALSDLGQVDTWAEGGLVGQFANTSAAWIAFLVA